MQLNFIYVYIRVRAFVYMCMCVWVCVCDKFDDEKTNEILRLKKKFKKKKKIYKSDLNILNAS